MYLFNLLERLVRASITNGIAYKIFHKEVHVNKL